MALQISAWPELVPLGSQTEAVNFALVQPSECLVQPNMKKTSDHSFVKSWNRGKAGAEAGCTVSPEKIWGDYLLLHTPTFLHQGPGLTSAPQAHTSCR